MLCRFIFLVKIVFLSILVLLVYHLASETTRILNMANVDLEDAYYDNGYDDDKPAVPSKIPDAHMDKVYILIFHVSPWH